MRFSKSKPKNLVTLSANYIVEPKQTKTWNKKTHDPSQKNIDHKKNPIHNKNGPLKIHMSILHKERTENMTQREISMTLFFKIMSVNLTIYELHDILNYQLDESQ